MVTLETGSAGSVERRGLDSVPDWLFIGVVVFFFKPMGVSRPHLADGWT